jgi:hypothetical protein
MNRPNRSVINAIELGINIVSWYAASFSSNPNDERAIYLSRLLLDNAGLGNLEIPFSKEARLKFLSDVATQLDLLGKKELAKGVRLGWAIGLFDKSVQENTKSALNQIMQLAEPLGITKSDILYLVEERSSIHQPRQAEILLKHVQSWIDKTTSKNKSYAFLCHASEDKNEVKKISDRLNEVGIETWLDKKDILPGMDWDLKIKKGIKEATVIIVFLSPNSIDKKGYVQKEVNIALDILQEIPEEQIFLIPAMLQQCKIPYRLSSRQAVMLFESNGFDLLKRALETQLGEKIS